MAITVALDNIFGNTDATQTHSEYRGTLTFTGSYVVGGVAFSLIPLRPQSQSVPYKLLFEQFGTATPPTAKYEFVYTPGTNPSNGTLQVFSGATELTAVAFPAELATDSIIRVYAQFPLGQ
jgi:hypothetical protein